MGSPEWDPGRPLHKHSSQGILDTHHTLPMLLLPSQLRASHPIRTEDRHFSANGLAPEAAGVGVAGEGIWKPHRPLATAAHDFTAVEETHTLDGCHHRPFEVGIYVDVLGLLRSHRRRGHHHPGGFHLGRHVHPLRWRGVVWGLQGQQRLQGLLLEQAPDGLLLGRWRRRGRLRLCWRN